MLVWGDQVGLIALRVDREARPTVGRWMPNHAGAHRIELDIAIAGEHIRLALRQARTKPTFPERAAPPIHPVHILHVALTQMLHQSRRTIRPLRRQQQVDVIGHQYVSVHHATELRRQLRQVAQVERVVVLGEEAGTAIVPALDDMQCYTSECEARSAGHDERASDRDEKPKCHPISGWPARTIG